MGDFEPGYNRHDHDGGVGWAIDHELISLRTNAGKTKLLPWPSIQFKNIENRCGIDGARFRTSQFGPGFD